MNRHLHHVVGSESTPHHSGPNTATGGWSPIGAASKDELAGQLDKLRDWIDAKFDRLMDQREADRAVVAG